MEGKIKTAFDFVLRNLVWIATGLVGFLFLKPTAADIKTLFFVITLEAISVALSGLAVYAYTKVKFTNAIIEGDDGKMDSLERHSAIVVLGYIFIGVHLLVGLTVLGVYIAQFTH